MWERAFASGPSLSMKILLDFAHRQFQGTGHIWRSTENVWVLALRLYHAYQISWPMSFQKTCLPSLWVLPSLGLLQAGTTVSSFLCGFWESEILGGKFFPTESIYLALFLDFYRLIIRNISLNHWPQVINSTYSPTPLTRLECGTESPKPLILFDLSSHQAPSRSYLRAARRTSWYSIKENRTTKKHFSLWTFPGF